MLFEPKSQDIEDLFAKKEPEAEQDASGSAPGPGGKDRVQSQIMQGEAGKGAMEKLISHWVDDEVGVADTAEKVHQKDVATGAIRPDFENMFETGMDQDFVPSSAGPENALAVGASEILPIGGTNFGGGGGGGGGGDGGGDGGGGGSAGETTSSGGGGGGGGGE